MRSTIKKVLGGIALAASLLTGAQAAETTLDLLLQGATIQAGDKLFGNWSITSFTTSETNRSFNASNIKVSTLDNGGLDPGPGLHFEVLNEELSVDGNGIYAFVDLMFGFSVTVLDPQLLVKDNSLRLVEAALDFDDDDGWDVGGYIRETIGRNAGGDDLGSKNVQLSSLKVGTEPVFDVDKRNDSATFAPQREIWVTKNLLVWAQDVGDTAGIFSFEQRFSQTTAVPEPASMALAALALVGLMGTRRRRTH